MKKILYIIFVLIIIGGIIFIRLFLENKKRTINDVKESIVIIIPEEKIISYKDNPKGIITDYKSSGIGAGFFISDDGLIQTVNHLIEDDKINYKIIYNDKEYESIVISRNKEKDLALLKMITEEITMPINKYSKNIKKNENIISFGIDTDQNKIIYNTGIILNTKSKLDDLSNLLEISNILTPGFSGGPIINSEGKVIGINYATSKGKNYGIIFSDFF